MGEQDECEKLIRTHLLDISKAFSEHSQLNTDVCKEATAKLSLANISGDMNHVYRVDITYTSAQKEQERVHHEASFSVVVKMASKNVLYLEEDETIPVDPKKIEQEFAVQSEFLRLYKESVPRVYLLDIKRKAIVMEDMKEFKKLTDLLRYGGLEDHISAAEKAGHFIGCLHKETWLLDKTEGERKLFVDHFSNPTMRHLMSVLLFDKPFNAEDKTNRCNPGVRKAADSMREDVQVKEKIAATKKAFLNQDDCLCHGDFSTDNILLNSSNFKVIDFEFSGIGLRAYDLAVYVQILLYSMVVSHHKADQSQTQLFWRAIHMVLEGYTCGVGGKEMVDQPLFVDQVCSLIACELMWGIFGSYAVEEFNGEVEPEIKVLSLAKSLLLFSDKNQTIAWNIDKFLHKINVISYS